ncbi:MAG: penicillin-binding protein 2 [Elusimicrobiales bacterium]|nr:penicillin-binding protein 2 [Elusimicrobiales bacterium]
MAQIKVPRERLEQLRLLAYVVCSVIGFRLVDIQLLRHDYYRRAAEKNRTLIIHQNAPRGRIVTRDNVALAANEPSFSLIYLPGRFKDPEYLKRLAKDFASRLGMDDDDLLAALQRSFDNGTPARLAENLSTRSMFAFSELKTLYPGVDLVVETKRYYPFGHFASHLIGYMGRIDAKEWPALRKEGAYRVESKIGRSGIEKRFESKLKGRDGGLYLEVDYRGKLHRVLQSEPWISGSDVRLTLDFQAQKAAEEGLKNSLTQKGAVVAINPQNGALLALASSPDFDPNMFVVYSDTRAAAAPLKVLPEYNLAIQGLYAPGSVFKIITASAILESGLISPKDTYFCPGYYNTGNRVFKCWDKKGHGKVNFLKAITNSCDVYFYNAGLKVGPALIEQYEREFRLGMKTGVPMVGEKEGYIFGPSRRGNLKSYWFIGDTLNLSIGQGELLVTPIQMAQVIAAVANGGIFWRPRYVDRITDPYGREISRSNDELLGTVKLKPESWRLLREALKNVVDEGTGVQSKIKGLEIYGKTGTAQNPQGGDNAWFVAYAQVPGRKPEVAVAVLVQHGQHGASAATPIARDVIAAALRWDVKTGAPVKPAAEKKSAVPEKTVSNTAPEPEAAAVQTTGDSAQ